MGNDFQDYKEHYQDTASLWFGKYKDIPIKDVPKNYLIWVKNAFSGHVLKHRKLLSNATTG